jgi:hypothetical protein
MSGDDFTPDGPASEAPAGSGPGAGNGGAKAQVESKTFVCSICAEPSTEICVYCTKDTCGNHRCPRCARCCDCCECDQR